MKWFKESYIQTSEKNGRILVRRDFGAWSVYVNDYAQTNHAMWRDAMKRIRAIKKMRRAPEILMLGLGAGGEIKTLHTFFPECAITAVDYDPQMIELAKKLQLHMPFPFPAVLLGDASQVVPTIKKSFDLIIFDLFLGPEPSPLVKDEQFITALKERLGEGGVLLINVYKRPEYFAVAESVFSQKEIWKYGVNNLGAFW